MENWGFLALHTSTPGHQKITQEFASGFVFVWRRNWMESPSQSCSHWKCCFTNIRHCRVFQCFNLQEESRIDKKLLLQYQRWHHFPLLSCLYKFGNEKKRGFNIMGEFAVLSKMSFAKWMQMFMPGQEHFVIGKYLKIEKKIPKLSAFLPCLKLPAILETKSIVFSYNEVFCWITSQSANNSREFLQREQCFSKDN